MKNIYVFLCLATLPNKQHKEKLCNDLYVSVYTLACIHNKDWLVHIGSQHKENMCNELIIYMFGACFDQQLGVCELHPSLDCWSSGGSS